MRLRSYNTPNGVLGSGVPAKRSSDYSLAANRYDRRWTQWTQWTERTLRREPTPGWLARGMSTASTASTVSTVSIVSTLSTVSIPRPQNHGLPPRSYSP